MGFDDANVEVLVVEEKESGSQGCLRGVEHI